MHLLLQLLQLLLECCHLLLQGLLTGLHLLLLKLQGGNLRTTNDVTAGDTMVCEPGSTMR
jgi:hypothetical protein